MEKNKNERIEHVWGSTKGSGRALPSAEVWKKIEQQIFNKEAHLVSINQWRIAAVAAVLLITFNVFSIRHYLQNTTIEVSEMTSKNVPSQSIISNYQLYD